MKNELKKVKLYLHNSFQQMLLFFLWILEYWFWSICNNIFHIFFVYILLKKIVYLEVMLNYGIRKPFVRLSNRLFTLEI